MKFKRRILAATVAGLMVLFAVITFFFVAKYFGCFGLYRIHTLETLSAMGALLAGVVGPVLSFIGIVLIYWTLEETNRFNKTQVAFNKIQVDKANADAILKLYEIYSSGYFFEVRMGAWRVLMHCIESDEYKKFLVNNFFVSKWQSEPHEPLIFKLYSSKRSYHMGKELKPFKTIEEIPDEEKKRIINWEYLDRHHLDDLLNFLSTIALKAKEPTAKKAIGICNFGYKWYRSLLWWLVDESMHIIEGTNSNARVIEPVERAEFEHLIENLKVLDEIFQFEADDKKARWLALVAYWKSQGMFDSRHTEPF